MRHSSAAVLVFASFVIEGVAQTTPQNKASKPQAPAIPATALTESAAESSDRLPVKRVVLYKNGVGYFEHTARVRGTQDLSIDFTTSQLNDVLKSLTAVDLGDGRISSVRYNSIAPLDERLKSLRLPFGEQVTQAEYLSALRGARVEVHSGAVTAAGRLLSVETIHKQHPKDDYEEDVTAFSIVTDTGEMRNYELGSGTSVRIAERELTDEVGRYLNLIASSRARDVRRMSFTAAGAGERDIFVSYVSEVPIWKSTYRIIIPEKQGEKPLLQGWAIVDNTIGEDWKDVQLSLVAGAPQSFIQNISQPFYARRPVVPLPQSVMLTPQSQEATLEGGEQDQVVAKLGGETGAGMARASGGGVGGGVFPKNTPNAGISARSLTQMAQVQSAAPAAQVTTGQLSGWLESQSPEAEGQSLGDFFEYKINQKVTINKNQSALVPILQAHIEAEKVTLWNEHSIPLRALWIKNTSGQVLDSGSFNILEADSFAGEGIFETIHPDERRLLSYAGDAAVHVKQNSNWSDEPYRRIRIAKGTMMLIKEERKSIRYTIRNADTEARQVIVESPAEGGWTLSPDTPKPEETSESFHRFRVPVDGGKTAELTVESVHPQQTVYQLTNLDNHEVELLIQQKRMTPTMQEAFDRILKQKVKIEELSNQISQRKQESDEITADQNRIRENMKALKGTSEEKTLLQRYVGQLDSQESRLALLRKESSDLTAQQTQAKVELDRMIMEVNVDESF
jgi:hypothetical protein